MFDLKGAKRREGGGMGLMCVDRHGEVGKIIIIIIIIILIFK